MKRILRVPVPKRVIVVGRFERGKVRDMACRFIVMRVVAMGGVMIVRRQFGGFFIVDVNMIAAGVRVKKEPGAKNGQRREEQTQRGRGQARDAGSPLPHDCCDLYHTSRTSVTHFMQRTEPALRTQTSPDPSLLAARNDSTASGSARLPQRSDFSISPSRSGTMRGLSVLDLLIILIVVVLLLLAGRSDFARYAGRTIAPPATATPHPAN